MKMSSSVNELLKYRDINNKKYLSILINGEHTYKDRYLRKEMANRKEVRTPLGDYTRVSNNYYRTPEGDPWSMNWAGIRNGEAGYQAGSFGNPSAPTYFQTAYLPGEERIGQYVPDFKKSFNTPLGNLNFESNYEIPNSKYYSHTGLTALPEKT